MVVISLVVAHLGLRIRIGLGISSHVEQATRDDMVGLLDKNSNPRLVNLVFCRRVTPCSSTRGIVSLPNLTRSRRGAAPKICCFELLGELAASCRWLKCHVWEAKRGMSLFGATGGHLCGRFLALQGPGSPRTRGRADSREPPE